MKLTKLIFMLLMSLLAMSAPTKSDAQQRYTTPLVAGDTMGGTNGIVNKAFPLTGGYYGVLIEPTVRKIGSTGGINVLAVLMESSDGVNYYPTGDSVKTIVATRTWSWKKVAPLNRTYKVVGYANDTSGRATLGVAYIPTILQTTK